MVKEEKFNSNSVCSNMLCCKATLMTRMEAEGQENAQPRTARSSRSNHMTCPRTEILASASHFKFATITVVGVFDQPSSIIRHPTTRTFKSLCAEHSRHSFKQRASGQHSRAPWSDSPVTGCQSSNAQSRFISVLYLQRL